MFLRNEIFIKWEAFAIGCNATMRMFIQFSTRCWVLAFYLSMANLALAAESAPNKHLIVGSELDFPPFALVREGGRAEGFTAELWRAVAREAHLDATIKTGPFYEILEEFKSGQIDVLINLALSDERRRFADFSVPHVKMAGAVFARKGDSRIKSEEDLAGKSLIVINADLAHDYALKRGWTHLALVDTVANGMKLLASTTRYDAMLVGRLVGLNTIKELRLDNLQPLQVIVEFQQDFAFAVRSGNADLLARINDGLANVRTTGAYDTIYAKWFGALEPRPLNLQSLLKYLVPAVVLLLLLMLAYLRERTLRLRAKTSASALDATIESTADGILVLTLDGRLAHSNRRFLEIWRVPEALVAKQDGREVLRLVREQLAEPEGFLAKVQQLSDHPMAETFDLLRFKDGRYCECVSKPQIMAQRPVGRVWSFRDVSERIQAENALRENEAHLQAVLDSEPACVKLLDRDCRLLDMNPAGLAMIAAQSVEQVRGCSVLNLLAPEYHPEYRAGVEAVFRGERTFQTFEVVGLDDQRRWMEQYAVPLWEMGKSGRVKQMLAVSHDITERKRAEEALRASRDEMELRVEERTAELTRSNALLRGKDELLTLAQRAGHTGLWSRDLETGKSSMSPEWCELMGFPLTEESVSYAEFLKRVHPDDRSRLENLSMHQKVGEFDREFRIAHPVKGERWILSRGRRGISTEDGHLYMMGALIDITERRQAEEALRESEARLRAILDHNPAPVFIKDVAGRYVHVNNRFEDLFGLHGANSVGKTDAELFASEQAKAFQRNDRKVLDLGRAIQFEEVAQYYDGEHTSIVTKFPLRDGQGNIYGLCGIATDITERKRAEEALRKLTDDLDRRVVERTGELAESQARLRALVAQLSRAEERERRRLAVELHDYLAQMLTISRLKIGRASMLAKDDALKKRLGEAQEAVDDSIAYTRTLMAQLSPRVLYDLGLPAALAWLGTQQKERHGLDVDLSGEAEGFVLDEERSVLAFQCVRELLWNIVKHAETNQATVSYALEQGELTVEVADDGRGFDLESLSANGNGVEKFGLFSIRERLELFGGKLAVTSQPRQGTRARFTLPAPQLEIAPASMQGVTPTSAARAAGKRLSVALVDDHEVVRRGLRQLLEEFADLTVVGEANDGLEGIELARQFRPDVVVMDVNMPGMNGIEATKLIVQEMPSTIVVGLSFESDTQITQAMKAAGAFTCVTKERAVEDIHQAIVAAVEGRRNAKIDNGELIMEN